MKKGLYWTPRIIMIVFIAFISLFALDAFEGDQSFIKKLGGFLIHLTPSFVLIVLLIVTWKYEWVGAITFFLIAIAYVVMTWGRAHYLSILFIPGPLILTSVLFWLNWVKRKSVKNQTFT